MRRSSALKYFYLLIAAGWTLLIAFVCLNTFSDLPSIGISGADKYVHGSLHFVFTILWFLYCKKISVDRQKTMLKVIGISLVYGVMIEVAQELFTVSRKADILDVVANTLGAVAAGILIVLQNSLQKR